MMGVEGEATGYEAGFPAVCLQTPNQCLSSVSEAYALIQYPLKHRDIKPFEQFDALGEGGREIKLALHRHLGNSGDFFFHADEVGNFIDAFVLNQRRIHIHQQQAGLTEVR